MNLFEGGKPIKDTIVEINRGYEGIESCIEILKNEAGSVIPMNLNKASKNRIAFTQKEPIGLVLAISAFNHPFNLIIHQIIPAIAVGCPVIVKPSEDTPLSCISIIKMLKREKIIGNRFKDLKKQKLIEIDKKQIIHLSSLGVKSGYFFDLVRKIFKIKVEG